MAQIKVRRERTRHKTAFEYYYSLGSERSHEKVATHFSCSVQAVKQWSRSFQWKRLLKERAAEQLAIAPVITDTMNANAEVAKEIAPAQLPAIPTPALPASPAPQKGVEERRENNLKIIDILKAKAVVDIKDGRLKIETVSDLKKLMEAEDSALGLGGDLGGSGGGNRNFYVIKNMVNNMTQNDTTLMERVTKELGGGSRPDDMGSVRLNRPEIEMVERKCIEIDPITGDPIVPMDSPEPAAESDSIDD